MKRFMIIFLVLVFLTACGTKDKEVDSTIIETEDGQEITVSKDMEGSLPVPEDFPKDIIPVYKGAQIIVSSSDADSSYHIMAFSKDAMEEIITFYKNVFDDSKDKGKTQTPDTYTMTGSIDGYTYIVSVSSADDEDLEYEDYESMLTLIVMKEDVMSSDAEPMKEEPEADDSQKDEVYMPNSMSWPDAYPEDALPTYKDGDPQLMMVMDMGEVTMISLLTKDDMDTVNDYYKSKLENTEDFSSMMMPELTSFSGTVQGKYFQITITDNNDMDTYPMYETTVNITYSIVE